MDVWVFLGWFLVGAVVLVVGAVAVAVAVLIVRAAVNADMKGKKGQG